ncbi:MAG: lipoyl synthase [Bacteroidales bacterium]|nr:lipoyl synthase [Bacteroidales bacterium]MCF8337820.1 lipoyl synthase [Bacteroidales bacterium]
MKRKPQWLKTPFPKGKKYMDVREVVEKNRLHTICTSGKCPNMAECWGNGTATFMILGDICTRSCKFCATQSGKPNPPDWEEPERLAETIRTMNLKHCVITSVDRDDLEDGGAAFWAETVRQIQYRNPGITIETLIPDLDARFENIQKIVDAQPNVISHNLETVRRLTPQIRSRARYEVSLQTLRIVAQSGIRTKSGFMVGMGESQNEILETMDDLLKTGCRVLTIGQYMQPTRNHWPVKDYIHPDVFEWYRQVALEKGFKYVESAPLVRSSYHAEKHIE